MEVLELIPQRAPMVMVDRFDGIDAEGCASCSLEVRAENIFVDDGVMSECGVVEHMAQTAAARAGYLSRERGEQVRIGYIGSVKGLVVDRLPRVGEVLHSQVEVKQEVFNVSLVEVVCSSEQGRVAACQMKIFIEQ